MMTGSCVMKSTYWEETVASMFDTLNAISTELGIEFEFVNVGGGLGIPYKPDEVRALPCAAAWKDIDRHGKTWKEMERDGKMHVETAAHRNPSRGVCIRVLFTTFCFRPRSFTMMCVTYS